MAGYASQLTWKEEEPTTKCKCWSSTQIDTHVRKLTREYVAHTHIHSNALFPGIEISSATLAIRKVSLTYLPFAFSLCQHHNRLVLFFSPFFQLPPTAPKQSVPGINVIIRQRNVVLISHAHTYRGRHTHTQRELFTW